MRREIEQGQYWYCLKTIDKRLNLNKYKLEIKTRIYKYKLEKYKNNY